MNPTEFIDALNEEDTVLFSSATNTRIRQRNDTVFVDTPEISASFEVNVWAISPSGKKVDLFLNYQRIMTIDPKSYKEEQE